MEAVASATTSSSIATNNVVGGDSIDLTQDRFLKLLIAQMKSQDPLNPLDNAQITSQLAQLSTVTGINKLSDLVSGLSATFTEGQSLQAAGMIGRGVFTLGNTLQLSNGTALAGVELPQAVDELTITIKDAAGVVVHSANLGPQDSGIITLEWDGASDTGGPATNGVYTFEIAAQSGGVAVETDVNLLSYGKVNSVTLASTGALLNIDGIGATALSDIKQIL